MNYGMNRTGNLPADPTGKSQSKRGGGRNDVIPKGYRKGQIQQFTPEQMELYSRLFGFVDPDSDLARLAGGDESRFEEIEAPAKRQFSDLLGGISSRFSGGSGRGSLGGRHSSAFQNTTSAAANNFAQDLASRRHELQRQAIQDLRGFSSDLLGQRPYENLITQKQQKEPGFWERFGQSFANQAGNSLAQNLNFSGNSGGGEGFSTGNAANTAAMFA